MLETLITIVGNVVDDPQWQKLDSGVTVANLRVASTSRRFDRATGAFGDGDSLFIKVNCWRTLGDNVAHSVAKGDPVVVMGRLYTRSYTVNEQRRVGCELDATAVGFDLSKGRSSFTRNRDLPPADVDTEVDNMVEMVAA